MSPYVYRVLLLLGALFALLGSAGCGSGDSGEGGGGQAGVSGTGAGGQDPGPASSFESDNPDINSGYGGQSYADAGSAAGGSAGAGVGGSGGSNSEDPQKTILEADIIQIQGNKLYALSEYGGLGVVDMTNPDQLVFLGRYRTAAVPFEMYVRDNLVLAMYSTFYHLEFDATTQYYQWISSSRVLALDTTDPAHITLVASFDIPGEVSDSRLVGDTMYVVSHESGYCWHCANTPQTVITSFNVANPKAISSVDQLVYTNPSQYSWAKRSIAVYPDRLYVAGPEWTSGSTDHSTIQVVDISDPAGKLVAGASVPVKGQIESRWQMDEYQGVLRVISQAGSWGGAIPPTVETFQVDSSKSLTKLGELTMVVPQNERLQSVRFDGTRAYAVTFVRTDPLYSLDLSDPSKPIQVGELEMPGFLYHMEPRGDRMIALGIDNNNPEGGVTVSVFDVSDLSTLKLLSRVNFGGNWGWANEDQDRIQKAFRIFDTNHLIVVPFSGYTYNQNCGTYTSGVQLVDLNGDTLTLRGLVPQHGQARRAFIHQDRLVAVSDERVSAFNIDNRDNPLRTSELEFVHKAYQSKVVGSVVAQLSTDWYSNQNMLVVTPLSDPDRGHPLSEIDLTPLVEVEGHCGYYYSGLYNSRLFANGSLLYMVWDRSYYDNGYQSRLGVAVFDLSDPYHPSILSKSEFQLPLNHEWSYYDYAWGYWSSGLISSGSSVVQSGSTLALSTGIQSYYYYGEKKVDPQVHVIDLSEPTQPKVSATFPLPVGTHHTLLQVNGSTLLTSHAEAVAGNGNKVRFYLDRYDLANPASPVALPPVNVPGSLLTLDETTARSVTVDYKRESLPATTWSECSSKGGKWTGDYYSENKGECIFLRRIFKLAQVGQKSAQFLSAADIDDGRITSLAVGSDRVFLLRGASYWYGGETPETSLQVVSGIQSGTLQASTPKAVDSDPYAWGSVLAVAGQRVLLEGNYPPHLSVYSAANPDSPTLTQKTDLFGYVNRVEIVGNKAVCSLGDWGLQTVEIAP